MRTEVRDMTNFLMVATMGKKWKPQQRLRLYGETVPCVDIFIPCYGEDIDIIADTIKAAIHQDYPTNRYRVIVLDDGNSPSVRKLVANIVEETSSTHLYYGARGKEVKIHSKAANICYGLELVKSLPGGAAPFFGILDVDMIVAHEWIRATLPFLEQDELVALAGSPQKFYNLPKGHILPNRFHLEFDILQRLFDSKGTAMCQGTGFIARVSAFEAIGGFPTMGKQEDSFTVSIILQAHGFKIRMVEEELQHGIHPLSFGEISDLQAKWMAGMIHIFSLIAHPVLASKPLSRRVGGLLPILHWTLFRLFLAISLPAIVFLIRHPIIPNEDSSNITLTLLLAFIAQSATYAQIWLLSIAADDMIPLNEGHRLWLLPYQVRGACWLVYHAIVGETRMKQFRTTGANGAAREKRADLSLTSRLIEMIFHHGAWVHLLYAMCLIAAVYSTVVESSMTPGGTFGKLLVSIAYPSFARVLIDCLQEAIEPVVHLLCGNSDITKRDELLERNKKTGVARPSLASVTHPKARFWGPFGTTAYMWLYFALVPLWYALV